MEEYVLYRSTVSGAGIEGHPKYQSLIGGLLFIGRMTRPAISVHVNLLAKDNTMTHWNAEPQVLRNLPSTKHDGLPIKAAQRGRTERDHLGRRACGGEEARSHTEVMITWNQPPAHRLNFGNGSRVYRRLRSSEGAHLDQPILTRTCDQGETAVEDGQREGMHPHPNWPVGPGTRHRKQIPRCRRGRAEM